jgi:RimJ/RimL family protein N-acetyltransferase
MQDGEVRLEPLASAHLEGLAELGRDPDVQRFTYVPSPWIEGFERTWLQRYDQPDGEREGFAIVDGASGEFLGMTALVKLDRDAGEAEAGYSVAPERVGAASQCERCDCSPSGRCRSSASSESS